MTLFVVMVQHYALKHANSLAVEADQKHYSSDIFLNLAVIIALLIDLWGGSPMVDQGITFGICAYMIWTGSHIGIKATDMLMDKEINQDQRQEILNIIDSHPEILGVHDLRTRQSGMHIYISFDIELDPDLTLKAAHDIARDVELNLLEKFPNADIMIHKDPKGDIYDTRHKVQGVHH
jgi:ferrous-iron efflux pump FieF